MRELSPKRTNSSILAEKSGIFLRQLFELRKIMGDYCDYGENFCFSAGWKTQHRHNPIKKFFFFFRSSRPHILELLRLFKKKPFERQNIWKLYLATSLYCVHQVKPIPIHPYSPAFEPCSHRAFPKFSVNQGPCEPHSAGHFRQNAPRHKSLGRSLKTIVRPST